MKTLQDRPRLLRPRLSTVGNLVSLPRPASIGDPASGERHIFSVLAAVTLVRSAADPDLHLVLEDGLGT